MNEEITYEAEPEVHVPSPVLTLPGYLFFVDRIELPEALEASEIDDFAELSLEGLAPFPIEQLYWGFLHSESAGSILLYAAYKERIKGLGYENLENYLWVLPDFAALWGASFSETTRLQLESDEGFCEIEFGAGQNLPSKVVGFGPNAEKTDHGSSVRLQLASTNVSEKAIPAFYFEAVDATEGKIHGNWEKLVPDEDDLWRADIRDAAFKKNERNTRKLTTWITRATAYAALFAVLLVVLEGVLFAGDLWLETQQAKIAAQASEVRRIEDKQSLMNKLDQVAQNELRPIAILEALNEPRPEGIYFTSTVTEGQNRITIDGIANTINELNAYTESLRSSGNFELLEAPRTLTRGGKTTFTATLDYIHTEKTADNAENDGEEETG
ncbi:MAG TPA: PilN domain-containing protein [Opitutales bacterium]|nr:PilN domain-containing protein [Opitutales bacterium]